MQRQIDNLLTTSTCTLGVLCNLLISPCVDCPFCQNMIRLRSQLSTERRSAACEMAPYAGRSESVTKEFFVTATCSLQIPSQDVEALQQIAEQILWLSTAIVHHANHVRPNPSGLKVGGHQTSSASMVEIMTSLYFEQLQHDDRVSVKPHASPVLHAINYLLG